ncbi:alpha/beta fold hydrolase [Paracoccus tegillarcae]|uniref:AB hydrolase-1 domain-containing protein n=1 Tax=Paracoccus tegillarcae TaxID=1529068 RepID=A0A2K9F1Z1_9RHOB|nr:alpha/beta fold hydrolase [Paracoccus tegillarcae]AUH33151.1 hypothetical protein CUV01_06895 [Paracoccus tegillarcae]
MWTRLEGNGPPVVFLHGWLMDHGDEFASYDAVFAARGYRRIYFDLPGMGRSTDLPLPHDLDGYADQVAAAIRDEIGDQPFLLSGTSAGALIACGVAARMPESLRGLLLRVPMIHGDDQRRRVDPVPVLHEDADLIASLARRDRIILGAAPIIQRPAWIKALLAKMETRVLPAMRRARGRDLGPLRGDPARYDMRQVQTQFQHPALILVARQDDNVGWRDAVDRSADWPRATLAVLDAAGHEFPLDHQMPLAHALIEDWLDRVELAP